MGWRWNAVKEILGCSPHFTSPKTSTQTPVRGDCEQSTAPCARDLSTSYLLPWIPLQIHLACNKACHSPGSNTEHASGDINSCLRFSSCCLCNMKWLARQHGLNFHCVFRKTMVLHLSRQWWFAQLTVYQSPKTILNSYNTYFALFQSGFWLELIYFFKKLRKD